MSGSYDHAAHVEAHARGVYYHTCRTCGCTDPFPCVVGSKEMLARSWSPHPSRLMPGRSCTWVEVDLCSFCAPAETT